MFAIYPFIALNAALCVTQCSWIKIGDDGVKLLGFNMMRKDMARVLTSALKFGIVAVFTVLSVSRIVGQVEDLLFVKLLRL